MTPGGAKVRWSNRDTARIVIRPVHVPLKRAQSISRLAVWEETRRFKYNIQHRNTRVHRIVNRIELRIQYNLGAFFQERQKIIAKHQEHWRRTFSHTSYKISEALLHYNQSINQSINQHEINNIHDPHPSYNSGVGNSILHCSRTTRQHYPEPRGARSRQCQEFEFCHVHSND